MAKITEPGERVRATTRPSPLKPKTIRYPLPPAHHQPPTQHDFFTNILEARQNATIRAILHHTIHYVIAGQPFHTVISSNNYNPQSGDIIDFIAFPDHNQPLPER